MALSEWDKKHLDANQQRAVQTYTAEWEKAKRAGDTARMEWAHNGAEAIRRQAGYSGGDNGGSFAPAKSTSSASTNTSATKPEGISGQDWAYRQQQQQKQQTSTSTNSKTSNQSTQSGGKGYDNGSLSSSEVKTLQAALGVDQDGYFGPKTQAAAFQRWGASNADAAMKSYKSTSTPARTSFSFDEDEGIYHWNGQSFTTKAALTAAMNKADLSAAEKNIVDRKATNSGAGVQLQGGSFRSTTQQKSRQQKSSATPPSAQQKPSSEREHSGSGRPLDEPRYLEAPDAGRSAAEIQKDLAAAKASLNNARGASRRTEAQKQVTALEQELAAANAGTRQQLDSVTQQLKDTKAAMSALNVYSPSASYEDRYVTYPKLEAQARELESQRRALTSELTKNGGKLTTQEKISNLGTGVTDFVSSVISGGDSAWGGLFGALTMADEATGNAANKIKNAVTGDKSEPEPYVSPFREYAEYHNEKAADTLQNASEGRSNLGKRVMQTGQAVGNMLASSSLSSLGVGTGAGMGATFATSEAGLGASAAQKALTNVANVAAKVGNEILTHQTNAIISAGSAGHKYIDATNRGADQSKAMANAILSGLLEYESNKMFSGTPLEDTGEKGYVTKLIEHAADKLGKSEALGTFLNSAFGKGASIVFDKAGEGFEEVITALGDPILERITWNPEADLATVDEVVDSFLGGLSLSLMMSGGEALINNAAKARDSVRGAFSNGAAPSQEGPLYIGDDSQAVQEDVRQLAEQQRAQTPATPASVDDARTAAPAAGNLTPEAIRGVEVQKNAAPVMEAAEVVSSPAQDAGSSGHPVSGPSGQSLGQTATQESGNIVYDPAELVKDNGKQFIKKYGEDAYVAAVTSAWEKGDVKANATGGLFAPKAQDHIDNRTAANVSPRSVQAFQFQNPEIQPYYGTVASVLMDELNSAEKGGQIIHYGADDSGQGWNETYIRTKRGASKAISELLDDYNFSYKDIDRALKAIMEDKGQENIAVAKRLEILIDELIESDYTSTWGPLHEFVDIEGYREAKSKIRGAQEREAAPQYEPGSWEAYKASNQFLLDLGEVTEDELRAEWEAEQALPLAAPELETEASAEQAAPEVETEEPLYLEDPADLGLGEDGLGAADAGSVNTDYDRLQAQSDKFHPSGPDPVRHTDVPTTNFEGRNIPKSTSTIYGAQGTPDAAVMQLEQMIADGKLAFDTITDKDAVASARATMEGKGFEGALEQYRNTVASNSVSKNNTALGQQLLLQAMREGNTAATAELLTLYTRNSTNTAQALQAESIFRKLSPEGQLTAVQRAIDSFNEKHDTNVQMSEEDISDFVNAESEEEREAVRRRILEDVASAVPGTFKAKYDAIRYLAMLGNPRTHIRNILGNTIFQAPVAIKNRVGAVGEVVANALSGGDVERTKSLAGVNPFGSLAKEARADFDNVKELMGSPHKYIDGQTTLYKIEENIKAFSEGNIVGKGLNALAKGNSDLLEAEDTMAKRFIYTQSLAGYLQANGVKTMQGLADTLEGRQLLDRARNYAAQEAMRNTFNDRNAASDAMAKLGGLYRSENPVERGLGYVVEGVLPFKRTPTNILLRSLEYSPAGAAAGIVQTIKGAKAGDSAKITEGIDRLAAGMTGTGLMYLGAVLAGAGLIRGGDDEDEKQAKFDDLRGHQNYSVELSDGTSVTLDWLAPEAIPFFMGVELYNAALDGGVSFEDFQKTFRDATAPMLEMSMLQGLNNTFDNAAYAKNSGGSVAGAVLTSALTSYATQIFPTIFGQAERSFGESERMATYTDKNSAVPSDLQYTLGKVSQKIPGWDYNQIPYIDAWGRTESTGGTGQRVVNNFLNPAFISQVSDDAMENELQRLYDATGEAGVLPQRATKYFTADGERKDLTGEEYVAYATEKGQLSRELISEFLGSAGYAQMDDAARAKAISELYSYANAKAKESVFGIGLNSSAAKIEAAVESGISPAQYFAFNAKLDALTPLDGAKGVSDMQRFRVIAGEDMGDDEKLAAIGAIMGTDMTTEGGGKSTYAKMLDTLDSGATLDQYLDLSEAGAVDSYLKYQSVQGDRDYGIKPETFAQFQTGKSQYDADGNNSYTQKEVAAAIEGFFGDTLTAEQKAVIWQLYNKSWKAKNNPYSSEIGGLIYDGLHAAPTEEPLYLEAP